MSILIALVIFSMIVLFHELGHFLLAKLNGVRVVEFSLGMGPRLLGKEYKGTIYSIRVLPFGGACMMAGEDEVGTTEDSFGSKSVWARMSIIAAGPVFNFIMAFIASVIVVSMSGHDPAVIVSVMDQYPAQEAGVQEQDEICSINGKRIYLAREVSNYISFHQGEDLHLVLMRDGEKVTADVKPKADETGRYIMGIGIGNGYVKGNFFENLKYGAVELRYWIDLTLESIKMLFSGKAGIRDMAGPVGVVNLIGDTYTEAAKYGWMDVVFSMLNICILLSANLGVMNLLPIPALDGGRLFFLLIELIRGKRIDPEKEGFVHFAGLMLLMLLMMIVMFNDVMRLI